MILQVSVIGIIAVGVTQVIITGGIDLSSGSVVALSAMVAPAWRSRATARRAVYPSLTDLPVFIPSSPVWRSERSPGLINGTLIAFGAIPPFIATLGMMVTARGLARLVHPGPAGQHADRRTITFIGSGAMPVVIFLSRPLSSSTCALRYTRYGKFTYAIGANMQAARVSGINVSRHLIKVYAIAGLLVGPRRNRHLGARRQRPGRHGHVV